MYYNKYYSTYYSMYYSMYIYIYPGGPKVLKKMYDWDFNTIGTIGTFQVKTARFQNNLNGRTFPVQPLQGSHQKFNSANCREYCPNIFSSVRNVCVTGCAERAVLLTLPTKSSSLQVAVPWPR